MFLSFDDHRGDSYELQYCLKDVDLDDIFEDIEFDKEDSLYIDSDEVDLFENYYFKYFDKPHSTDKSFRFSPYGPNYYDKNRMAEILKAVKQDDPPEGRALIFWLENAPKNCNGFYFLGI